MPILPSAPERFSTITCVFSACVRKLPMRRAPTSVEPPGGNGTSRRMVRWGQSSQRAGGAARSEITSMAVQNRAIRMGSLPFVVRLDYRRAPARLRPSQTAPAASSKVPSSMPYSTYLPEHMGRAELTPPGPFVAGSYQELTVVYTAGKFGIDDTGMLKISWRTTSDMSKPQFDQPTAANYTTVEASNGAKIDYWFDRLNIRPWANTILIRVGRGYLREGDTITVRLGDRRLGSPGFRLQTNCEAHVELRMSVDAFAAYEFCEVAHPAFDLVPGPATSFKAIWPSLVVAGEPFRLAIVAEDMWGNPTEAVDQRLALAPSRPVGGLPESVVVQAGASPLVIEGLRADGTGDIELVLTANGAEVARANPL